MATPTRTATAIMNTATDPPRDSRALERLLTWLSPAFPTGGFGYSHGLEQAVAERRVTDAASLTAWLETLLDLGAGWTDAVLLAEAHAAVGDPERLIAAAQLAAALAPSTERLRESQAQGAAFLKALNAGWPSPVLEPLNGEAAYCIAVGATAAAHGVALADALPAFLQAFAGNLVNACLRLMPLGQTGAVAVLSALEPAILAAARRAQASTLEDLGGAALLSDIMAMRHETLEPRLFLS